MSRKGPSAPPGGDRPGRPHPMEWASRTVTGLKPGPRHVLLELALHCGAQKVECWPSQGRLALLTGFKEAAIRSHLQDLEDAKLITRKRIHHGRGGGFGYITVITLNVSSPSKIIGQDADDGDELPSNSDRPTDEKHTSSPMNFASLPSKNTRSEPITEPFNEPLTEHPPSPPGGTECDDQQFRDPHLQASTGRSLTALVDQMWQDAPNKMRSMSSVDEVASALANASERADPSQIAEAFRRYVATDQNLTRDVGVMALHNWIAKGRYEHWVEEIEREASGLVRVDPTEAANPDRKVSAQEGFRLYLDEVQLRKITDPPHPDINALRNITPGAAENTDRERGA